MRFVFVSDELPRAGFAGHNALNQAIIDWLLSQGHQVEVVLARPRLDAMIRHYPVAPVCGPGIGCYRGFVFVRDTKAALTILGQALLSRFPARFREKLRRRLRARRYGVVDTIIGAFITPSQAAWCAARIRAMQPEALLIDTIFRAPVLQEPGLGKMRRVIVAHDLFHRRHRVLRDAGYRISPPELPPELEARMLNLADAVAAIQPEEAAEFKRLCPDVEVVVAPMPAFVRPRQGVGRIAGRLVFVGSAALPNLDGLNWFFVEIWPLLRKNPGITLDLVGDCGAALPRLPAGVRRLGRVAALSPVLHRAALAISPLRLGSGLKIKILDYARHGLATVATGPSLQGFAPDEDAPFTRADDAFSFAEAVASRLRTSDPADEEAALAYVRRHYDEAASFAGLAEVLGVGQTATPST